jgi:hypothetical protein
MLVADRGIIGGIKAVFVMWSQADILEEYIGKASLGIGIVVKR